MGERKVNCEVYTDRGIVGPKGEDGSPNVLSIGTVESGETASATITGEAPNQTLNLVLPKGDKGDDGQDGAAGADGAGISSISKTSTSGLVDTYTITMTDGNTTTFDVTNGKDGIDGQDGTDGTDGQDGFSPSATVSKSGKVTTLTVTDKDGTTTATINDGEVSQAELNSALALKQDTLVSGTNIKTVNGNSLLGSGNIDIDALPSQTGQSGKFLTTNGTAASWEEVNVPSDVWTQDNLIAGKNVTITKKVDPTVITEDTVAVWHFDGTGTDSVNSLHLQNYPEDGNGFRFDTNNKKFDSTSSMWKQLFADSYYSGAYFSNWQGADLRTYSLSSNKDMTIDFWYKPPVSTSATVARRGTIFALMYKSAPDYFSHGIYIVPNSDNTTISFGLANNYSGGTLGTAFIEDIPVTATFHHIAFELHGSTGSTAVTVYVDGVAKGNTTISNSSDFDYQQFNVFTTNGNNDAPSWVDELRLSKGLVYNGNFDNNLPTKPYSNDAGEDVYQINSTGGASKNIGEVYYSQSSSAQDNAGALPLFTGETISNADQVYPDFYAWVANHAGLQISAADYETALTTYGECPKYVIDTTNKTIRLPKLTNYVKMANTTDGITQSGAGLPNITGSVGMLPQYDFWTLTGAFSKGDRNNDDGNLNYGSGNGYLNFDASLSNSIYGNSNTVTPAHTTLYPWVCAYNAAIPASTAQAAAFQQALTSKADTNLSNVTGTSGFRKLVEVYSNGASWYKVFDEYDPVTGTFIGKWCEQGGLVVNITPNQWTFVTLLKEYADANYTVIGSGVDPSVSTNTPDQFFAYRSPLQTTGFYGGFRYLTGSSAFTDRGFSWRACGYLATES